MFLILNIPTTPYELKLYASENETVGVVMNRFNKYRSPSSRIFQLYSAASDPISFDMPITTDLTVWTVSYG